MFNSLRDRLIKYLSLVILLACINFQANAAVYQSNDSAFIKKRTISHEDIIRGERLFYGLVHLENKSTNCAICHNLSVSDTLNWNPDALEISKKYLSKTAADLAKVLRKPVGAGLIKAHKGIELSSDEIVLVKAFMDRVVTMGLKQSKPDITNLLIFIIASLLFLVSTIELIIKKIYKKPWINWSILLVTGTIITWILAVNAIGFGRATGFSPEQPVKFSHAVHAGQNKIDCIYCHFSAKISKDPGIPSGNICMNCHLLVRNGTRSGAIEIAKVVSAFENKKPVKWVRIYKLPDFVFFSHAQHVTAAGIDCMKCHGDVKKMDRLFQVTDLSMGWCIKCHDSRKVNIANNYYKTYYPSFYDSVKAGKTDSIMASAIGARDCGKCHY